MKEPQCGFAFDLMSTKTTLNVLRTHFHFETSDESGDNMNLVSFCFTFNEYENETKRAQNHFSWL